MSLEEVARRHAEEGWQVGVKRVKGYYYLIARRSEGGGRREKSLGRVDEEAVARLRDAGIITTTIRRRGGSRGGASPAVSPRPDGGLGGSVGGGFVLPCFHNVQLRYVRGGVDGSRLLALGFGYDGRNGQWSQVFYLYSRYRRVTVQVNSDGSAQVYLRADEEPLDVFEFLGWCRYWLLERFRELTGRDDVSLGDFVVMTAPELNVDVPGVLLEGARSVALSDYYDALVRVYVKSLPGGGVVTRVEARDSSYKGVRLSEVAEGIVAAARLPMELSAIKRDLELIKGSLPKTQVELGTLRQVLMTELANLIYLSFEKVSGRFELALREFARKVDEILAPFAKRLEELEEENRRLRAELEAARRASLSTAVENGGVRFGDLPEKLRRLLLEMQRDGYVRVTEERVSYGDKVWEAIYRRRGNLDYWLEYAASEYLEERELFRRVILAIRYYDNRYGGKPGVPWGKFLEALELLGGGGGGGGA